MAMKDGWGNTLEPINDKVDTVFRPDDGVYHLEYYTGAGITLESSADFDTREDAVASFYANNIEWVDVNERG